MLHLFFGSVMSVITTVFVLALLAFAVIAFKKRGDIGRWGRLILIFILAGTAVSAFSATRDAYMMENALFAPDGLQSLVCSVAGGLIFLTGIVSLFVKNQKFRKAAFQLISVFFIVQVLTVEVSRIILL
jgi:uncharacterized membrane protein